MKKTFLYTFCLFVLICCFSCNEKDDPKDPYIISNWYPIELRLYIQDENSVDLLNYDSSYYVGGDFMLSFNGNTYRVQKNSSASSDDSESPVFHGLVLVYDIKTQKNCVYFGGLEGYKEYDDDFIITWKDGTKDVIHFSRKITGSLDSDDKWLLNGVDTNQDCPYGVFTLTK